jgi:hypothetical protein
MDTNNKISEESIRRTFRSIGFNCAAFEFNNETTHSIIEDFEEEGTICTHNLYLHIPTYQTNLLSIS